MNLTDFFSFGKTKKKSNNESASVLTTKQAKKLAIKTAALFESVAGERANYNEPEYDLAEYKLAAEGDSYVKMAEMKYKYLMFKAGYELKSDNPNALEYLNSRLKIMSFLTSKPFDITLQEVSDDLIRYSNAFLIKTRVDKMPVGISAKGLYGEKPIGSYTRIDPCTITIKRDKNGNIQGYNQKVDDSEKKFKTDDVVHFYLDKEPNNAFGTPRYIAALEDVKFLRKAEGNAMALIHRFSLPIYQWIIGLAEPGFQATEDEIEDAKKVIENMYLDGAIVTSERTNIKTIGSEGTALDLSSYLNYFERRVFTSLGVSESQMGRGGAKQDADSMESQAHDVVKYIQKIFAIQLEFAVINELLIEGGFDPLMNVEDMVTFSFNEISLETKIKVENHEMLKFQSNITSIDETRVKMGLNKELDEARLHSRFVQMAISDNDIAKKNEAALELAQFQYDNALQSSEAQGSDSSQVKNNAVGGNGKSKTAENKDVQSRNTPSNQHGKYSAQVKESFIDSYSEKADSKNFYNKIFNKYYIMRNDIAEHVKDRDIYINLTKVDVQNSLKRLIDNSFYEGVVDASNELNLPTIPNVNMPIVSLYSMIEEQTNHIFTDLIEKITTEDSKEKVYAICDSLTYRLRYCIEYILPKAYWFAYVKAGESSGKQEAYIKFSSEKDSIAKNSTILTNSYKLEDIPAYHSFCNCKISFTKGDDI